MSQKKLMLLGGIRYLLPVIEAAHRLGVYVITADYLPNNIAHKYSDEYVNVNILDREAVLQVAREKEIDGIMSFGVDPGVVTAAYVADKMGLNYPPLASCEILQNKDKFRDFLAGNGFNCPWHKNYSSKAEALKDFTDAHSSFNAKTSSLFPCIVKPVDSAGSKGCTRVDAVADLPAALDEALGESHSGRFIIEQFLELDGRQSGSDCFSVDNELVFCTFGSQYFDQNAANPYAPIANTWPSIMPQAFQDELRGEIQRLIRLLNLGTALCNIETRVAKDGKAYIMEVSPRAGGNCMAEVISRATGQDIISANVMFALGMDIELKSLRLHEPEYDGVWAYYVVRSEKEGRFKAVEISDSFKASYVKLCDIYVEEGDPVHRFTGANRAMGILFLRFDRRIELERALENQSSWLKVAVE